MNKQFSRTTRLKMAISAKARCTPEWREKQRLLKGTILDKDTVIELYNKGHTQIEIARLLKVSQKVVWRFMKNNGITARKAVKRNQSSTNNANWKGGKIIKNGYVMIANTDTAFPYPTSANYNRFALGLGVGYKIGFIDRPRK